MFSSASFQLSAACHFLSISCATLGALFFNLLLSDLNDPNEESLLCRVSDVDHFRSDSTDKNEDKPSAPGTLPNIYNPSGYSFAPSLPLSPRQMFSASLWGTSLMLSWGPVRPVGRRRMLRPDEMRSA